MSDKIFMWLFLVSLVSVIGGIVLVLIKLFGTFAWGWLWTTSLVWIPVAVWLGVWIWHLIDMWINF